MHRQVSPSSTLGASEKFYSYCKLIEKKISLRQSLTIHGVELISSDRMKGDITDSWVFLLVWCCNQSAIRVLSSFVNATALKHWKHNFLIANKQNGNEWERDGSHTVAVRLVSCEITPCGGVSGQRFSFLGEKGGLKRALISHMPEVDTTRLQADRFLLVLSSFCQKNIPMIIIFLSAPFLLALNPPNYIFHSDFSLLPRF